MKQYFVITNFEGEEFRSVKTEKEIGERWESADICGYDEQMTVFDYVDGEMVKVSAYKIAQEYLAERDAMRKEYEEYCETVREYGFDYESAHD